jgi:hypothetical protein
MSMDQAVALDWKPLGRSDAERAVEETRRLEGYDVLLVVVGLDRNRNLLPARRYGTTLLEVVLEAKGTEYQIVIKTETGDAVIQTQGNLGRYVAEFESARDFHSESFVVSGGCAQFLHDGNTWRDEPIAQLMIFL